MKTLVLVVLVVLMAIACSSAFAYDWVVNPANGHFYTLVDNNTSWQDAENKAVAFGGHLVTIRSAAENEWLFNWVVSVTPSTVYGAWIGMYQLPGSVEPAEGWVWSSGEPVTYTNWQATTGEPNNYYGSANPENWAKMYIRQHDWDEVVSYWNDTWFYEPTRPDTVGIVEVIPPEPPANYEFVNLGRGEGTAINELNMMTGCRYDELEQIHPFFWTEEAGFTVLEPTGIGRDINNVGEIVGFGGGNGIYWSVLDSTWQNFNGTNYSVLALANNDLGQIVGYSQIPGGTYDSIIWNNFVPEVIDDFGGLASWAYDINENGTVVGELNMSPTNNLAYMWTPSEGTQTLAGIGHVSTAQSINDLGQIAGSFFTPGESNDFFIWKDGVTQYLSDNYDVSISRINNKGVVVGRLVMPTGIHHAFYWTVEEGIVDLTPQSLYECAATDINDNGYISGIIYDEFGHNNITLWKPVVEPTYAVSGTITLSNYSGDITQVPISVRIQKYGATASASQMNLDNSGNYGIINMSIGLYGFSFKASHWLRKTVKDIAVSTNATVNATLINGDVDGDNNIDSADLNLVKKASGSTPGSRKWNANADLNGDNKVNKLDQNIVKANLGKIGDN